jgi:hypothetical protein
MDHQSKRRIFEIEDQQEYVMGILTQKMSYNRLFGLKR